MSTGPSEQRCYIVAEIGINHQGVLDKALDLMQAAKDCGCDAVKFQKRTISAVYTAEELSAPRKSVYGETNGDLKRGLEFGYKEYAAIDTHAKSLGLDWFASPWDEESVDFLVQFKPKYLKIASASTTDKDLVKYCSQTGIPLLVSTGMLGLRQIQQLVRIIERYNGSIACLYHCTSTYPSKVSELNLRGITTLRNEFPGIPIGYSGHEVGVPTSIMAAVLGACSVERHITLNRADWGSDQAASLEKRGMRQVVSGIRQWEEARGDGHIKVYDSELPIIDKLRRVDTLFDD